MTKRFLVPIALVVSASATAEQPVVLDPVTVTVTAPRLDGHTTEIAPKLVFQAEQLSRFGSLNLGELLRRLPGVAFVSEAGGFESPQLRGIGPEYTQLLIDGRRISGVEEDRSTFVDRIPADLIERIEIIRSPTADLDAQGVGGSLNVVLKSGAAAEGTRVHAGSLIADDGTVRAPVHGAHGGRRGAWSWYGGLTVQPDFESRSKEASVHDAEGELLSRRRGTEVRDTRSGAVDGRGGYRFDNGATLDLVGQVLRTTRDTNLLERSFEASDPLAASLLDESEDERQTTHGLALRTQLPLRANLACNAVLDWTAFKATRGLVATLQDEDVAEPFEQESLRVRDRETQAASACTLDPDGPHRLRFGGDLGRKDRDAFNRSFEFDDGEAIDVSPFGGAYGLDETRADVFAQNQWTLSPRLALDFGLRLETTRLRQTAADEREQERQNSDRHWLPNAHLRWTVGTHAALRASVARTLRRPRFEQLIPFRQRIEDHFEVGNPQLRPERALGFDLGYESEFAQGSGSFGVSLFHRKLEDLIQQVSVAENTRAPANTGTGRAWGIEFDARYALDGFGLVGASLSANLSLLDSSVRDPETGEQRRFEHQPAHVFNLAYDQRLSWRGLGWGLALAQQGDSEEPFEDSIERAEPGSDLDAYIELDLSPRFTLRLAGRHLLDAGLVDVSRDFDGSRAEGELELVDRERESLGPSLLLTLSGEFR